MTELKPCPFCGGEAILSKKGSYYSIECDKCGCGTKLCGSYMYSNEKNRKEAAKRWNRRVNNG